MKVDYGMSSYEKNSSSELASLKIEDTNRERGRFLDTGESSRKLLSKEQIQQVLDEVDVFKHPQKPKPFEFILENANPVMENTLNKSGFFKKLFFFWINPLFNRGSKQPLQNKDLFKVPEGNTTNHVRKEFDDLRQELWKKKPNCGYSPLQVAFKLVRKEYFKTVAMTLVASAMQLAAPYLSGQFLTFFEDVYQDDHTFYTPLILIAILGLVIIARALLDNHASFRMAKVGCKFTIAIRPIIFEKMLHMNMKYMSHFSETTIVTLMTTDVANLVSGFQIVSSFINAFFTLSTQFVYLYQLGWLTFVLIGLLLLVTLCFKLLQNQRRAYMKYIMRYADSYSKMMRELVRNITQVKIGGLEEPIYRKIMKLKGIESNYLKKFMRYGQAASILTYIFPTIFGLAFFAIMVARSEKDTINYTDTFIILTVLSIMRSPLSAINKGLTIYPSFVVSRKRILAFLSQVSEKPNSKIPNSKLPVGSILLKGASYGLEDDDDKFSKSESKRSEHADNKSASAEVREQMSASDEHEKDSSNDILQGIDLDVQPGSVIAIVGLGNCGKTFLLHSIMGETNLKHGSFEVQGKVGFLAADCTLIEDSIAQNILLGDEFDAERFAQVVKLCKLDTLLNSIAAGDQLVVRDNGTNVTSKMKRRICLARLLYRDFDIYLFDNFFDEVDVEFLEDLLEHVVRGKLRGKTILITTTLERVCMFSDKIMFMQDGQIVERGGYSELSKDRSSLFYNLVASAGSSISKLPALKSSEQNTQYFKDPVENRDGSEELPDEDFNESRILRRIELREKLSSKEVNKFALVTDKTHWKLYFKYFFFNYGWLLFTFYILLALIAQLLMYSFNWFTAAWKAKIFNITPIWHVYIYVMITAGALICLVISSLILVKYARKASYRLFYFMIRSLIAYNLDWYRENLTSTILSVFVTDYSEINQISGSALSSFIENLVRLIVGVGAMMYKTWFTGLPIFIVFLLILYTLYTFCKTVWSVKQICTSNMACLVSVIMDTRKGLITFRNCGYISYMHSAFKSIHDVYQNVKVIDGNFSQRWIATRLNFLAMAFPFLVMVDSILDALLDYEMDFMWAGIKISIAFDICFSVMGLVGCVMDIEAVICDLDGVVCLINEDIAKQKLKKKKDSEEELFKNENIAEQLQKAGLVGVHNDISFQNVSYLYPLFDSRSLRNVTFSIKGGERVAFCGHNLSGKHTILHIIGHLASATGLQEGLVRVGDRSFKKGDRTRDTSDVMLLGSNIFVLQGSLRDNIDPFHRYDQKLVIQMFEYLGFWDLMIMAEGDAEKYWNNIESAEPRHKSPKKEDKSSVKSSSRASEEGVECIQDVDEVNDEMDQSILSFNKNDSVMQRGRSSLGTVDKKIEDGKMSNRAFAVLFIDGMKGIAKQIKNSEADELLRPVYTRKAPSMFEFGALQQTAEPASNLQEPTEIRRNRSRIYFRSFSESRVKDHQEDILNHIQANQAKATEGAIEEPSKRWEMLKQHFTSNLSTSIKKLRTAVIDSKSSQEIAVESNEPAMCQMSTAQLVEFQFKLFTERRNTMPGDTKPRTTYTRPVPQSSSIHIGGASVEPIKLIVNQIQEIREEAQPLQQSRSMSPLSKSASLQAQVSPKKVTVQPAFYGNTTFGETSASNPAQKFENPQLLDLESPKQAGNLPPTNVNMPPNTGKQAGPARLDEVKDEFGPINPRALKYLQTNIPFLYRGIMGQSGEAKLRGSLFSRHVAAFDPDNPPIISPARMKKLENLLHTPVRYQGKNLSHSQKKLLQIGKALLAKPNIVLLDSGFFKVEPALENLLLELIMKNLRSSTIVAIVEKFQKLKKFDKVFVLNKGTMVEVGPPQDLLGKPNGHLRSMVERQQVKNQAFIQESLKPKDTAV